MLARVLIATDDDALRVRLAFALHEAGFEVVTARTGVEAIVRKVDRPLAAVVLDLDLPDDDGLEVLGALAARQETIATPVLALSAVPMPLPQGAIDLLLTPVATGVIVERVEDLVNVSVKSRAAGS